MKRLLIIFIILLVMLLRETGVVNLNAYQYKSDATISREDALHSLEARHVRFEEDDGTPFRPDPAKFRPQPNNQDETYYVVVRYRFSEDLSWTRWLPLYKSGNNTVQLLYTVWLESSLAGCGVVDGRGRQTIAGFCSAKEYRDRLVLPLIDQMHQQVNQKIHLFTR